MTTPVRMLRADIEDLNGVRPEMSFRELDRRDRILDVGRRLIANYGREAVTMKNLAEAMFISAATLRRYYPDMDHLLGEILRAHLRDVSQALARVPFGDADRRPALRAAYIAATRTPLGAPTEPHLLLLMTRQQLPRDERMSVERHRDEIGDILAGALGRVALNLLDMAELDAAAVERMLAATPHPASQPAHQPQAATLPEQVTAAAAAQSAPDADAPPDEPFVPNVYVGYGPNDVPPAFACQPAKGQPAKSQPARCQPGASRPAAVPWPELEAAFPTPPAAPPARPPRQLGAKQDTGPAWSGPGLYATAIRDLARARAGPGKRLG